MIHRIQISLVTLWACFLLLISLAVHAQSATPQERERARGLMDQGDALMAAEDYRGALEAYAAADEIMRVPTTGIEVGRAQRKLGLLMEARDTWVHVTRFPETPDEPLPFTEARHEAARLAVIVASLIPTISIQVEGPQAEPQANGAQSERAQPSRVKIHLDGALVSESVARVPLRVNPGRHVIRVEAEGFLPVQAEVTLDEGKNEKVLLRLFPATSEEALEGAPADPTQGDQATTHLDARRMAGYVGLGVGVVGVTVGSFFGATAVRRANDAKALCDDNRCPPEAESFISASKRAGTISTIGFGVGAAGVAAGLYFLLTRSSSTLDTARKANGPRTFAWDLGFHEGGAEMTVGGTF